jgi:predicted nucleic acid-binding protein
MIKDSFLDTNVIIHFANYQDNTGEEIVAKCYFYIVHKQGKFIVCYAVIKELFNVISKLGLIHKEVLKKIEEEDYSFKTKGALSKKDILFAEKLYFLNREKNKEEIKETFSSQRDIFEIEIEKFLKTNVDEKVIPIEQIDNKLVSKIYGIIPNHADSRILASALQLQEKKEKIFLFVTADAKDLDPNGYKFLKEQFEIDFPKEKYRFPELLNLMFK